MSKQSREKERAGVNWFCCVVNVQIIDKVLTSAWRMRKATAPTRSTTALVAAALLKLPTFDSKNVYNR